MNRPDDILADVGSTEAALKALLGRQPLPRLAELAARHSHPVWVVGGALRDALLGRGFGDVDIGVGGDLEGFIDAVAAVVGRRPAAIGDPWRDTHRFRWHNVQIDIAGLLGPLHEDLSQRDFTINAMALALGRREPRLEDPHGGLRDLAARCLRCPRERVLDADPLRVLRAVRHATVLDGFTIDDELRAAMIRRVSELARVAPERICGEWDLLLRSDDWLTGVALAAQIGDLVAVTLFPLGPLRAGRAWTRHERSKPAQAPTMGSAPTLAARRLAALFVDAKAADPRTLAAAIIGRRWPARVARFAARVAEWARAIDGTDADTLAGWAVIDADAALTTAELAMAIAHHDGQPVPAAARELEGFARRAAEPVWVGGRDLLRLGMSEGPELGRLLGRLRRGQVRRRWSSAAAAREWARRQLAAAGRQENEL